MARDEKNTGASNFGNTTRVGIEPIMFLLELPDGQVPGDHSAHVDFHHLIVGVQKLYPGFHFQIVPAYYKQLRNGDQGLSSIYLIAV